MKENNVVVVLNAYDEFRFNSNTVESIRYACSRWKCSYLELTEPRYKSLPEFKMWNKIWMVENLKQYDKVLYLDMDMVVSAKAPNLFDELGPNQDLGVVLDGNPGGRFVNDFYKKEHVEIVLTLDDCINVFKNNVPNFNQDHYRDRYFNTGMLLFRPDKLIGEIERLKDTLLNNKELFEYLSRSWATEQNLLNGWIGSSNINIKYMDNKWNWIAPDMENHALEKPMEAYIYHFCGTLGSKESLLTFNNWK